MKNTPLFQVAHYPSLENRSALAIAISIALGVPASVQAKDLFELEGDVWGLTKQQQHGHYSANNISDLTDTLNNAGLSSVFSQYNQTAATDVALSIRGIPARASYAANSTALHFQVPSLGIDLTFRGQTRDESQDQFKDFLKGKGSNILTQLLQEMAATSPVDPVAGNPSSLQGQMAASTFSTATGIGSLADPSGINSSDKPGGVWSVPNLVSAGGDIGVVKSGGYTSMALTLPLRYSLYMADPRYALTFDLPLTYVNTQGAQTGMGSFGVSFRVPVLENWYLIPSARVGATGSADLGAAAVMYSGDITSLYNLYQGDLKFSIGNSLGYYQTNKLSVGGYDIDYDLTNTAMRNAVSVEGPLSFTLFSSPASWQAYIIDTQMFGDKLYLEHYDELGVLIGTRHSLDSQSWDSFQFGLSWTTSFNDDYNALKANFSYRF